MNEKFFDLKKEKQDKMINGAMKVFAINGYHRASTDDMVKVAGVSKGLWFHYFGNKLGLYTFVTDYAVKYMNMELTASVTPSADYYDVLYKIEETKMAVHKFYPFIPLFLSSLEKEKDPEALQDVQTHIDSYHEKLDKCSENIDRSLFLDSVNFDLLDKTVRYTMNGLLSDAYETEEFNPDTYMAGLKEYFDMMKALTFKEARALGNQAVEIDQENQNTDSSVY